FGSGQEIDVDTAAALGNTPPHQLSACVIGVNCAGTPNPLHRRTISWHSPNVGSVSQYLVYRVQGPSANAGSAASLTLLASVSGSTFSAIDTEELPNGVKYTYFVRAKFANGNLSNASNFSTITAVNDAPIANVDSYSIRTGNTLSIAARGVLANDTD